jgi:hypothetical protein
MNIVQIPKKSGGYRTIYAPNIEEKEIFRGYLPELESIAYKKLRYAHAFIPGRSPVTAALAHAGRQITLCWDLSNFFDSCTREQIAREGVSEETLDAILIDGAPRQGLPTSPSAANLAAVSLDRKIAAYLGGLGTYTRYADDLTISVDDEVLIPHLVEDIPRIIESEGFKANPKKTRIQRAKAGRRVICGVAVGEEPKTYATRSIRRRLRAAEHQAKLPTKNREKAAAQAKGLREWCKQRLPVQRRIDEKTKNHALGIIVSLEVTSRRTNRWQVREQLDQIRPKDVMRATRELAYEGDKVNAVGRACRLIATFGSQWNDWLKRVAAAYPEAENQNQLYHDWTYWLPTDGEPNSGLGKRLIMALKDKADPKAMRLVAKAWGRLPAEERALPWASLVASAKARLSYARIKHMGFASLAQKAGCDPEDYPKYESRWLRAVKKLGIETNVPMVGVRRGSYTAHTIPRTDPRCVWAGDLTDCCQHPDGEGASCAWHSVESPNGAILSIEHEGKMVGQAWVWTDGDWIVLDNIEALGNHGKQKDFQDAVFAWARAAKPETGVVTMGLGNCDMPKQELTPIPGITPPKGCYSDACHLQVQLA